MIDATPETLYNKGLNYLERNEWTSALACFEKAAGLQENPVCNSYLALCISKERGQTNKGVSICMEALEFEPQDPAIYLNLGKIYLMQGKAEDAIRAFREGLSRGADQRLVNELMRLGSRRPPPLSFLKRENPINKYLGILLARLGLR